MNLHGKTIVVTGVSSGIGAEVARLARFEGAQVIGVDRNDASISMAGFVKADLSTVAGIDAAVAQLPAQIDALCNIAGVPGTADRDLVARVNYLGLRHLSEQVLPRIRRGGGIVNVASILGAEWPLRLDVHKALAAVRGFDAGAQWLQKNPVPQETCYQYFKEALIVWNTVQSQEWFLENRGAHELRGPRPGVHPHPRRFRHHAGRRPFAGRRPTHGAPGVPG